MKPILFLITGLLLSFSVHAGETSITSGQRLFKASRCLECHGVDIFTSKERRVKDLSGLEKKVRKCDASLSTNWFDDQIMDVVAYLNATYYQFESTTDSEATKADAGTSADVPEQPDTE